MATTSKGITYPLSTDNIAPLETWLANLATTTNTALGAINAGTDITAGTLPITRGGTGGATASAALTSLGAQSATDYVANSQFSGKNKILNGAFDVWQRASTGTTSSSTGYFADRWRYTATGAVGKVFAQTQGSFSAGTAPVAGYEGRYYYRIAVSTAGTSATYEAIEQPIEDVRTFAGQTVTLSFWAKASATTALTPRLEQYFGTGGTPSTSVVNTGSAVSLTTSWQRFSQTFTVASISGKVIGSSGDSALIVELTLPVNTAYTVDIWGVQLEAGSTMTAFTRAQGSLATEIAGCQRYYYRATNNQGSTTTFGVGVAQSTTTGWIFVKFPVTMRINPNAIETSSVATTFTAASTTTTAASTVTLGESSVDGSRVIITVAAGLTAGGGCIGRFAGTAGTAYLGFSAEL